MSTKLKWMSKFSNFWTFSLSSSFSPVSCSLIVKQDRRNSSCADVASRHSHPPTSKVQKQGVCCPHDATALESLVIISTPAPVVSRPAFSHAVRNSSRRALQQSKGLWGKSTAVTIKVVWSDNTHKLCQNKRKGLKQHNKFKLLWSWTQSQETCFGK